MLGLLVVLALLVTGCGLRTPAGVRVDQRSVDTAVDDPDIRKLPPGPISGGSPSQIVNGFLEASAADPDHSIAMDFLATGATWNDRDSATLYEPDSASPLKVTTRGTVSRIKFSAEGLGLISAGGAFVPAQRRLNLSFELRRIAGQWRLTYVPPGVLLTARDLARSYRPVRIYDFGPDGSQLVAEPGYVVSDRAGLAGAALHALLTGWGDAAAAVAGGLPQGLTSLGSVVVRDGEATVDLGREAFTVPQERRSRVVAQIASSLSSVPGVFSVRVWVEERPYAGGPVSATIPAELIAKSIGPVLAVGTGAGLVAIKDGRAKPVHWKVANPGPLDSPVSAPGGGRLAALKVTALGDQLLLADLSSSTGAAALEATVLHPKSGTSFGAGQYLRPQWLDSTRLILATGGSASRLELVDASDAASRPVSSPHLRALGPLSGFAVSRDGTRAIAVAGPPGARKAYLARITTASQTGSFDQLIVDGWTQLPTSLPDVAAASWSDDLTVTLLGAAAKSVLHPSGGLRVEDVTLDGVPNPNVLPALPPAVAAQAAGPGGSLSLTTAPGYPELVSTGSQTWELEGSGWVAVGSWSSPAYP